MERTKEGCESEQKGRRERVHFLCLESFLDLGMLD